MFRPKQLRSKLKHVVHCCVLYSIIVTSETYAHAQTTDINPWEEYGVLGCIFLYFLRLLPFLALPYVIFNVCGLTFFNAFADNINLKSSVVLAPFLCFRVVTKGSYPQLVRANVIRNIRKCLDEGLDKFSFEVVTDKPIHLEENSRVREIVVPPAYQTITGAMFKVIK